MFRNVNIPWVNELNSSITSVCFDGRSSNLYLEFGSFPAWLHLLLSREKRIRERRRVISNESQQQY
jgi:hypothetical protein